MGINRYHQVMPNTAQLLGNSEHIVISTPQPGSGLSEQSVVV